MLSTIIRTRKRSKRASRPSEWPLLALSQMREAVADELLSYMEGNAADEMG